MNKDVPGGEFFSAQFAGNAPGNQVMTLYKAEGTTRTLAATGERLLVSDISLVTDTASTISIYYGSGNSATQGKIIFAGALAANSGIVSNLQQPFYLPAGQNIYINDSSGSANIICTITGSIIRS